MLGEKPKDFKARSVFASVSASASDGTRWVFLAAILSTVFMIAGPKSWGDGNHELFEGAYAKFQVSGSGDRFHENRTDPALARWTVYHSSLLITCNSI
ncbi:hypothetical protein [Exiguobacterium acetylicum]|uniref:hypothetical protein n=1 Tax=Exiguobacterium acetylicum TaxID=41170 RepID=UPI000A5ECC29